VSHGHADHEPCGPNCPVGGADGAQHQITIDDMTLCSIEPFTDDEVAALREYFKLLSEKRGRSMGVEENPK
jgi:hypothetical protein